MNHEINVNFGGVPDGSKYVIEDTPETEKEWRALLSAFAETFSDFTCKDFKDYAFGDWHYGMRILAVYLHNEKLLGPDFIPKIQKILKNQKNESFAQFESFDSNKRLIGRFMVFKDKIIFDRISEQTGVLRRLIGGENDEAVVPLER